MRLGGVATLALVVPLAGCGDDPCERCGPTVSMDYAAAGFYAAPFPGDERIADDGRIDLADFPNPEANGFASGIVTLLADDARGFATTGAIFFQLTAPIALAPIDPHASVAPGSPVVLMAIDPGPGYLERHPVAVALVPEGGPFGAPNLVGMLPLQGMPLQPGTRYVAALLTSLGSGLVPAPAVSAASHEGALAALGQAGIGQGAIAGFTVFTTGEPTRVLAEVSAAMLAEPRPEPNAAFALGEVFDDFCVYQTTIDMPVYQSGEPPYAQSGGTFVYDADGAPILQRHESANFVVTIPRGTMPAAGYPLVVFSRTGGGGERPLVDRGVHARAGGEAIEPGEGPARYFARAGFAGTSIDGPHGGLRNITGGDEQFLVFNYDNPAALRDNLRQSAAELALTAHLFDELALPIGDCPGASAPDDLARIDSETLAIMGHSMGASIAPLTIAVEPRFGAMLLSGAGGSFIENLLHKQKPLATKGLAEVLLGIAGSGYSLNEHDPMLTMLQWAGESADVPPYAQRALDPEVRSAPHVLMMQGIVDHYLLPPIANTTSLAYRLDLGGEALDEATAELDPYASLQSLLDLTGRSTLTLPAGENQGGATAIVSQFPEDGLEDGHEVVFQTEAPKHAYRCFLASWLDGAPVVPAPGALDDPCP